MLSKLLIKNFAIIEEIEIHFDTKLNILIGETGAGKSIIIDALQILLGEKASTNFIRQDTKKSVIEGIFVFPIDHPVWDLLKQNEIELIQHSVDDYLMILRREINLNSPTRNFINDTPVQLSLLKTIGDFLIDFHGQYSHQILLNPKNHINILDAFANNLELIKNYQNEYSNLKILQNQLKEFLEDKEHFRKSIQAKIDDLNFINTINPKPNEDIELLEELKIIENSEILFNYYSEIANLLYDADSSLINQLNLINKKMEQIAKFNSQINIHLSETQKFLPILSELKSHIADSLETISYNPQRIDDINQRLYDLKNLIRKFGKIEEILEYKTILENELNSNNNFDTKQKELENEIEAQRELTTNLARLLSTNRTDKKSEFEQAISDLLKNLGFNHIEFVILIETDFSTLGNMGADRVEFLISTNKGEQPKPLSEVASGGETSRIMLALKSMAANDLSLPILVFDEIDTGVSGAVAHKIALQMKSLSKKHQIIAITHSPQVTAAASQVVEVHKEEQKNRTITKTKTLNEDQIIVEIAKFLSNSNVSDIAIQNARELRQSTKN